MDNYATHKTPKIKAWLARRPHYQVHFTPTSASWINHIERWPRPYSSPDAPEGGKARPRSLDKAAT